MSAFVCGPSGAGQRPDLGLDAPCCYESAMDGPAHCSCWEPVYEAEQQTPKADLAAGVRAEMCVDCAYRPNSPERTGDPNAAGDPEFLRELVDGGQPFWCHQGTRRPIHWRHPSGATVKPPGMEHAYDPPIVKGGPFGAKPYKVDGTPSDICGGWAALRLKALARQDGGS